jgi:hypothetical protein
VKKKIVLMIQNIVTLKTYSIQIMKMRMMSKIMPIPIMPISVCGDSFIDGNKLDTIFPNSDNCTRVHKNIIEVNTNAMHAEDMINSRMNDLFTLFKVPIEEDIRREDYAKICDNPLTEKVPTPLYNV